MQKCKCARAHSKVGVLPAALVAGEAFRTVTLVSTPYHWTFQLLWVLYWLTICLLVTFTTWLLVVLPVRSAKRAAKVWRHVHILRARGVIKTCVHWTAGIYL